MMKILFVITGLGVGGAERQVVDLASRFRGLGNEVKIAYLTGPARVVPSGSGIEVIPLGVQKTPIGFARALIGLTKVLRGFQPDVVHSHMVHANLLARIARIFTPVPKLICTAHSMNEGGPLRMLGYRLTNKLADVSTNVSRGAVRAFELKGAVPVGRMQVIPNGIDVGRFEPNRKARVEIRADFGVGDRSVLLAVGRFFEPKDYPNLLSAFSKALTKNRGLLLWIAGDGPLQESIERLAEELGVGAQVSFLGVRKDVPALMNAADVFVLASEWEGLPLVVGEAMASQKVVVATDVGGVSEFVGDAGFLVPPKNPEALAEAIVRAVGLDAVYAKELGERARMRIVAEYSLDSVVKKWIRLYSSR